APPPPAATPAAATPPAATSAAQSWAGALSSEIPLDPGVGGVCINENELEVGDIIVSTTDQVISGAIKLVSGAEVSHAMLYVGGQVIEAIRKGVVLRPLTEALAESTLAVVFRYPGLSEEKQQLIVRKAEEYLNKPYNFAGVARWGAARKLRFGLER